MINCGKALLFLLFFVKRDKKAQVYIIVNLSFCYGNYPLFFSDCLTVLQERYICKALKGIVVESRQAEPDCFDQLLLYLMIASSSITLRSFLNENFIPEISLMSLSCSFLNSLLYSFMSVLLSFDYILIILKKIKKSSKNAQTICVYVVQYAQRVILCKNNHP